MNDKTLEERLEKQSVRISNPLNMSKEEKVLVQDIWGEDEIRMVPLFVAIKEAKAEKALTKEEIKRMKAVLLGFLICTIGRILWWLVLK